MGKAPEAPDPYETANAQFGQNLGATAASSVMNNPNISGPNGSTNYTLAGYETITGPDGNKIQVPRYNQTTTLSKAGQSQLDERNSLIENLFKGTNKTLNAPTQLSGAAPWQQSYNSGTLKTGFTAGAPTEAFNPAYSGSDLATGYAPEGGFTEDRKRVEEAMMSRGTELLGKNRDSEIARLAAMGLAPGGEKYGRVADQFERSGNDLAMQAVLAGGQEQSRQLGEARAEGQFGNDAKATAAAMDNARTEMENARRRGDSDAYNRALEAYNNATLAQTQMNANKAGFSNTARQGMASEDISVRNNMINQLISMMTGGQVNQPQVPGYQGQGVGAPDIARYISDNYASEVGAYNNTMSGISEMLGLGAKLALGPAGFMR